METALKLKPRTGVQGLGVRVLGFLGVRVRDLVGVGAQSF